MSTYTYLTSIKSIQKLTEYISLSLSDLKNITYDEKSRNTDIVFLSSLSPEDQVILDGLMDAYTNPEEVINYKLNQIFSGEKYISNSYWYSTCSWPENGSRDLKIVTIFSSLIPVSISNIEDPLFSYECRVVDITNNLVLGEETFDNNIEASNDIVISNFCNCDCLIEIQIKKNTYGKYISIKGVVCKYL